jgi:uncharacterized membrane protein YdjX (TVP38/TMEM64 family)
VSLRVKVLLLIGFIAVSTVVLRSAFGASLEPAALIATMRSLASSPAAVPAFFLLFGVGTSVFAPAVAFMVTAGVTWGFWPGWVFVWGAANLWANVHFVLGRWVAGDALRTWLEQRKAGWLTRELETGGVFATVMIRQLPLPFVLVNLSAGASPLRWRKWAVGNAIGLVPNSIIYTQLAAALADGVSGAKEAVTTRALLSTAGVITLSLFSRWLQKRFAPAKMSVPASKEGA